jgi:hypothetical protein
VIDSIRRKPSPSKEIGSAAVGMYQVSMEKLACLRKRLAIDTDSAMTAALSRLWEIEIEKIAIAIQKEIDRRDA